MKVGCIIPLGENPDLGRPTSYRELRQLALQLEAAGFDAIWVYDHLLYRFPNRPQRGVWESWSILAPLAEATSRLEIGTLVMCTAWRNPALLAKMAVTLDEVSGGRFVLGIGAGWHEPEFAAFGYPFDHLAGRFEEAVRIIAPLLREGQVDFCGRYYSAPNCEMLPPARPGGIPLLIAGKGPRMLRLTAEYADAWNAAWFGRVEASAQRRADLADACRAAGRDPATIDVTIGVNVAYPVAGHTLDEPVDPDAILTGTPDEVAAALRAYEAAGVSQVICAAMARPTYAYTSAVFERLAEGLAVYRASSPVEKR